MTATTVHTSWADTPYKLINPPPYTESSHPALMASATMAHIHNGVIRGLNAIVQQAPHIRSADEEDYSANDVKDLMFYVESWCKMLEHHHDIEEAVFFPMVEDLAAEPGLLSGSVEQHAAFHDGLEELLAYAQTTRLDPDIYRWAEMKRIIDSFAEPLTYHLAEEIDVLQSLDRLDATGFKKCWDAADKAASSGPFATMYDMFPLVLGCCDKTFAGGNSFPPVPAAIPLVIKHLFSRVHRGAWRFNPCNYYGQPQPLQMLRT